MRTIRVGLVSAILVPSVLFGQAADSTAKAPAAAADTTVKVAFGGFVDTYYAYDFGRPPTIDRSFAGGATFTTQPSRSNEFNINLAYIEMNVTGPRVHGRLALQAGTSVQSNYAGEPSTGAVSGPSLSRMLQEAFAGYQVTPELWVDAGIFYSHMGVESWASKDNPTYSRSLVSDYSPFYSSGVRAIWTASPKVTARLDVVNGWQNISESNSGKGAGVRIDYAATATATLSYYNFFNDEAGGRLRIFNGAGAKGVFGATTLLGELDYGTLGAPSAGGHSSSWWGFTAVLRQQVTKRVALSGRIERFDDKDQVNIVTGLAAPFQGNSASVGIDVTPQGHVLWRTELRGFVAGAPVFPNGTGAPGKNGGFIVTSLALYF
jgi:hypothetical protein